MNHSLSRVSQENEIELSFLEEELATGAMVLLDFPDMAQNSTLIQSQFFRLNRTNRSMFTELTLDALEDCHPGTLMYQTAVVTQANIKDELKARNILYVYTIYEQAFSKDKVIYTVYGARGSRRTSLQPGQVLDSFANPNNPPCKTCGGRLYRMTKLEHPKTKAVLVCEHCQTPLGKMRWDKWITPVNSDSF